MPREAHVERQVYWKNTLQKYGSIVNLEKTVQIRGAPVIVDIVAEIDGKRFLIEIGDIADKRKKALMQFYAEKNPTIEFIHENYGENKIQNVLELISSYKESPEYSSFKDKQEKLRVIEEKQQGFNAIWSFFCFVSFVLCVVVPAFEYSFMFLVGVAVLIPFVWFLGFIIGNRSYNGRKNKISAVLQ